MKYLILIISLQLIGCGTPLGKELMGFEEMVAEDYCITPRLVYMPYTGDRDNCQAPHNFCAENPGECVSP